jgi:succinoglycan biosynthesis transport protein ExoP
MPDPTSGGRGQRKSAAPGPDLNIEHYLRILLHRWWLVVGTFVVVTAATIAITSRIPNIYSSETTILVDPQKVPETYVKATVTGDVRNRLGTLSQQILSVTRLQKIIDSLNLYPDERKRLAREDVIAKMRSDISVSMVSGGGSQDLQAFRIAYSGKEPRLVSQVTNQLATLFIDENLKAREQQATGTTEFLTNQLQEGRKILEEQEAKLRDFKLKHIGEMPEQQTADLQVLGQLQSQLQIESEALSRAEQQKTYLQSMMAQAPAPVIDMDGAQESVAEMPGQSQMQTTTAPKTALESNKAKLATLLARGYTERHPDVQKLKLQIAQEDLAEAPVPAPAVEPLRDEPPATATETTKKVRPTVGANYVNPVLQSQLKSLQDEISKHKQEQQRLNKLVAGYQTKLEAIPVREQQISELVRDYEISKAHYAQLLGNQLSAETATELEVRQKGEKFTVLDAALPAERPTSPKRALLNSGGGIAGLALGIMLALVTEALGMSITMPEQIAAATGMQVLEVIPLIQTHADKIVRKRRLRLTVASGMVATVLAIFAILFLHYKGQSF